MFWKNFWLIFAVVTALVFGGAPFAHATTMEEYLHTPKCGEPRRAVQVQEAAPQAPVANEPSQKTITCDGTLVKFNDGHYGLVADEEVEHGFCKLARIPKKLLNEQQRLLMARFLNVILRIGAKST